jgi:hypothetical protein
MFDIFRQKDAAELFIWTDGKFEDVSYSETKREVAIDYTDYCSNRSRFTFFGCDQFVMTDPVYCIHASHTKVGDKRKLELSDDDGVVVAFCYDTVQQHEQSA